LSRGILGGTGKDGLHARDYRAHSPRWQGENLQRNLELAGRLATLAKDLHATPVQLAIAWVLSRGKDIVPLVGSRTRVQLKDALGALRLKLSEAQLDAVGRAVPAEAVAGTRYPAEQMAMLDSERGT
jgi:aryl-alcohol dehydrogenase-like predicted oxidoreductase